MNFGDYIIEVLLERLGYQAVDFTVEKPPRGQPVLIGIGSVLEPQLTKIIDGHHVIVWGAGIGKEADGLQVLESLDYRAVRGPLTLKKLRLRGDLPTGDPALLLPRFFQFDERTENVVVIPHLWNLNNLPSEVRLSMAGGTVQCSTLIRPEGFLNLLRNIATAKFVLTGSLHAAVIAFSYGVPWAIYNPPSDSLDKPLKWLDWLLFLGITDADQGMSFLGRSLVSDYKQGVRWWECHAQSVKPVNTNDLLHAFPHNVSDFHPHVGS